MARHSQLIERSLQTPREAARLSGAQTESGRVETQGSKLNEHMIGRVCVNSPRGHSAIMNFGRSSPAFSCSGLSSLPVSAWEIGEVIDRMQATKLATMTRFPV